MTTEEKAKAYDEAKARISAAYNSNRCTIGFMNEIFPELTESEDERIKKALSDILLIDSDEIREILDSNNLLMQDINSWLKNQGKQKSIDDLTQQEAMDIAVAKCFDEQKSDDLRTTGYWRVEDIEQKPAETVKWSPQEESCICQLESLVKEQWRQADKVHDSVNIKKMSELMFFLKTLNPNKKPQRTISVEAKETMYNKPAWSEEDEDMIRYIGNAITCKESAKYLEEKGINIIKAHRWLESLKDKVQPQVEWGEWGKKYIASTIKMVEHCSFSSIGGITKAAAITWLKSLGPQTIWKPSDEQMEALLWNVCKEGENQPTLASLYNDLKKLKDYN